MPEHKGLRAEDFTPTHHADGAVYWDIRTDGYRVFLGWEDWNPESPHPGNCLTTMEFNKPANAACFLAGLKHQRALAERFGRHHARWRTLTPAEFLASPFEVVEVST